MGHLWPLAGMVLKVGLILAALGDWQNVPTVEVAHLARAMAICEEWRASAHRALTLAAQTDFDSLARRVLYQVGRREPDGATLRELYRGLRDKTPGEIVEVVLQLVDVGELQPFVTESGPKGGRPTENRYRLPR